MLPSYGKTHASYGGRRRDGKGVAVLAALLGLGVLLSSWGWTSSRHRVSSLTLDLAKLREQHSIRQNRRFEEMSKTRNVESQHHVMNKQLQEASRSLQTAQRRLQEATAKQDSIDKDCQRQLDDLADRLEYETQVGSALKKHIDGMEGAHRNREADWHHLAEKWKTFEVNAIEENQRLLIENARLQNKDVPKDFIKPVLPSEEPQDRPESHFDAEFHKPEYHAQVHHHEHHHRAAHEEQLDPQDQPHPDHQAFGQAHDTWQGDDWHAPGPNTHEAWRDRHDAWKDSYGVQHDSWQDVHGLHHDSWDDAHGVHHDSWQDTHGLHHDDWQDAQGMHHDSWQDAHGVHHETWQDQHGKLHDDWEDVHGMHHDSVIDAEGQYERWQDHHIDPPSHGRHEHAWQDAQRAQVPTHRTVNPSDPQGAREWEHGAAHGGAGAGHGGGGHGVPAWHGGSHEHGQHAAGERAQDQGRPPWRNPRS